MKVKELMEILKDVNPDMEVTVCVPEPEYYMGGHEYLVTKEDIETYDGQFSICVS